MTEDQQNEAFGNWLIQEAEQREARLRERRLIAGTVLLSFVSECEIFTVISKNYAAPVGEEKQ